MEIVVYMHRVDGEGEDVYMYKQSRENHIDFTDSSMKNTTYIFSPTESSV